MNWRFAMSDECLYRELSTGPTQALYIEFEQLNGMNWRSAISDVCLYTELNTEYPRLVHKAWAALHGDVWCVLVHRAKYRTDTGRVLRAWAGQCYELKIWDVWCCAWLCVLVHIAEYRAHTRLGHRAVTDCLHFYSFCSVFTSTSRTQNHACLLLMTSSQSFQIYYCKGHITWQPQHTFMFIIINWFKSGDLCW